MKKRNSPIKPITIVTVALDLDDRLKAVEKRLGIKLPPFRRRVRKYRSFLPRRK